MLRWFRRKMSDNLSSIDEEETDCDDAKQEVKSNMNSSLRSIFSDTTDESCSNKASDKCSDESDPRCDWEPSKIHGLRNSFPILQQVYIRKIQRGEKVDYFEILKDDVRNMRPLTEHQMEYVKSREKWELIEIIEILDQVNQTLIGLAGLNDDTK